MIEELKPDEISKLALFTAYGELLSLADHWQKEGGEALVGMVSDLKDIGEKKAEEPDKKALRWRQHNGMVEKEDAWKLLEKLDKAGNKDEWFLLFDFNSLWRIADEAKKMGFRTGIFPSRLDRKLEEDREFAKAFVKQYYPDLKVADVQEFKDITDTMEFLKDTEDFWVLKGNAPEAKTVVPRTDILGHAVNDIKDAILKDRKSYETQGFVLEKQIRDGIEVCPQIVWCEGTRAASCIDLEDKAYSDTPSASLQGCAINAIVETPLDCELNQWAFPEAVDKLAKKHPCLYYMDANLIIKDGEAYFLEFCSGRMGIDAIFAECDMAGGVMPYFNALVQGEIPYERKYGLGTRGFMTMREEDGLLCEGTSIQSEDWEHIWLFGAEKNGVRIQNIPSFGDPTHGIELAAFTSSSDDPEYAEMKLTQTISGVSFLGLHARNDAGNLLSRIDGVSKLLASSESGESE